jgi:tetratricopeptide (TPR) repeat protein/pimeloyl-ACP methyl ester carboxylesterase
MAEVLSIAEARGEKRANAIFFHGLGGDARTTWQAVKDDKATSWLPWLAQDIEGLAVYSVGYEAPVSSWRGSAMELSDRAANVLNLLLAQTDLETGELILVGHSLGGLVIKQLLRKGTDAATDRAEAFSFIDRVRKVAFLATPHAGADLAGWGDRLRVLIRPSAATRSLLRNDSHLRDLNLWYRRWARERKIDHLILFETKTTQMFGMIVKPDSSDPGLATDPIPIDSDHITIVKPANRENEIYKLFKGFILRHNERPVSHEERKIDAVKEDTQAIRENVDRLTAELSMSNAQREKLVGELAKVKAKWGGTVDLVSGFLETMVGRKIAPEQFAATLIKIAADWKSAGEKIDALSYSGNLSPRLSALRDQAKAAHEAGRLDEAERLLAEIAGDEIDALKWLEDHERDIQEEIQLRKRGVAETKAAQAAVAHVRLNHRDAAALYGEAAGLIESFDPDRYRTLLYAQARELYSQGDEFGDNAGLGEAIALFRQCLELTSRESNPHDWAATQNSLGNALQEVGERESGTQRLEEAVTAYREALKEYTQERVPLDWAMTQMNLGTALASLGERESGTQRLEEAVTAYREALKEYTQECVPLDWARTQMNLGTALQELGERESGTQKLDEAVTAYREALKERTRERVPLQWARTQVNLGTALQELGERESGTEKLDESVTAYREALKEYTQERVPLDWARTQMNLGTALQKLGERESGTEKLEEAVSALREALKELNRERAPLQWAKTQNNLGGALATLGERESGTACLEEAVAAFREALKERTQKRVPLQWAFTQMNLALVYRALFDKDREGRHLDEALKAADGALEEFRKAKAAYYIEQAESQRNEILALKGKPLPVSRRRNTH